MTTLPLEIPVLSTPAFLDPDLPLRREPRAPGRRRPERFWAQFEQLALFYDCFWSSDGQSIVLVGPPPLNLSPALEAAAFEAMPSGVALDAAIFAGRSTMTLVLSNPPAGTTSVAFCLGEQRFDLAVRPNLSGDFAGARLITTMNKDNDPAWIVQWLDWHVKLHGVDGAIVFDNGSTAYGPGELQKILASVPGMERVAVVGWPHRYGPVDPAVLFHPYWANFLQFSSFAMLFRRLAARAAGVLNCDIDELVGTEGGRSVFEVLAESPQGFVKLKGMWVEPARAGEEGENHLGYRYAHRNRLRAVCADKWAIDPKSGWLKDWSVVPGTHRVYGLSGTVLKGAPVLPFWHFKAINTNWKHERARPAAMDPRAHRRIAALDGEIARYAGAAK